MSDNALASAEQPRALPWSVWLAMTRPGFLVITLVACLLGISMAALCGHGPDLIKATATVVLALLAHAAANVFNDFHDALSGADALNTQGISPFTGGARLIQNQRVSMKETRELALAIVIFLLPSGLLLAMHSGPGVLGLGLVGLLLAWAYSSPPLRLMAQGWGEITVGMVWMLVVVGADYVQRGAFSVIPVAVAFSYGLLIANILLINGFPDAPADEQVNKRTAVVCLGPQTAAYVYALVALLAHAWVVLGVHGFIHPGVALWGLSSLPLSLWAAGLLIKYAHQPQRLRPAIVLTIAAAVVHGLSMAMGFLLLSLGFFI